MLIYIYISIFWLSEEIDNRTEVQEDTLLHPTKKGAKVCSLMLIMFWPRLIFPFFQPSFFWPFLPFFLLSFFSFIFPFPSLPLLPMFKSVHALTLRSYQGGWRLWRTYQLAQGSIFCWRTLSVSLPGYFVSLKIFLLIPVPFCRDALVANSLVQLLAKGAQTRIAVNHLQLRLLTGRALKTWAKQTPLSSGNIWRKG